MSECPHYPPEERTAVRGESRHEERSDDYWHETSKLTYQFRSNSIRNVSCTGVISPEKGLVVLGFLRVEIEMLLGVEVCEEPSKLLHTTAKAFAIIGNLAISL
jgi:hypothetical protein